MMGVFLTEHPQFCLTPSAVGKSPGVGHSYHIEVNMAKRQQNEPNFRINVFVYHPVTGKLVADYHIDQVVARHQTNFNSTTKACSDCIEAAQSTDGLRYIAYYPIFESWVAGGNRVFESTIG